MKKLFRKTVSVLGSVALVGATISGAVAASYPAPFDTGSYAVVYGSSDDSAAAATIAAGLPDMSTSMSDFSFTDSVTDDKVELGTTITGGTSAQIDAILDDGDFSDLDDTYLSWDDGTGSDEYNYHEVIEIGTMVPYTSISTNNKELGSDVALSNEQGLTYKFSFDEDFNESAVGGSDADTLYLSILGNEYEIEAMTDTSITVVTSEEISLAIGDSYTTPGGNVVTLNDVYSGSVEVTVDGENEVISTGSTERVNGVRVNVDSVGYHENSPETSKAILKIGDDISKVYSNGDEYIGEDEADPIWRWTIEGAGNASGGWIGVEYVPDLDDIDDEEGGDSIRMVGECYTFPHNFAGVCIESLTDVEYEDVKIYFEDSVKLYPASDTSTPLVENVPVIAIEAVNDDTITTGGKESNLVYLYWNTSTDSLQSYYKDLDNDYDPTARMRLANSSILSAAGTEEAATIEIGDTNLDIDFAATNITSGSGSYYLIVTNDDDSDNVVLNLTLGGTGITTSAGTLERLGTTEADADALDVQFDGSDRSTEDYSFMDTYGIKLSDGTTVEKEADEDEATLSVPDDRVYAVVTVGLGAVEGSSNTGQKTFMDSESSSYAGKNIVVVGGSCVNEIAATLLGGDLCGDAFTGATDVGPGQFLIESFTYEGKVATLVAGYEKEDTSKAATYLANKVSPIPTTNAGDKYIGQSSTQTAVLVS